MTFRKTKLIDNRPSWHPLRLCDKYGSQGDQGISPQSRRGDSFDLDLAKRILRAEDKSDQVYSSCGRKMKILHQLYSFVSSALFSYENEKSESEERFKRPVQALHPTSVSSPFLGPSLARSREVRPKRRAYSQAMSSAVECRSLLRILKRPN